MPPKVPDGTLRRHPAGYVLEKSGQAFVLQHRLVWSRIHGRPIPPGGIIHHINEIRDDNRIENLEFVASVSEHIRDKHGNGSGRGTGKPKSPEHRAKIAAALKGKPKSVEHRAALAAASPDRSGKRNPNYRHGLRVRREFPEPE